MYAVYRSGNDSSEKPTGREASDDGSGEAEERSPLHDQAAQTPSRGLEADSVCAAQKMNIILLKLCEIENGRLLQQAFFDVSLT